MSFGGIYNVLTVFHRKLVSDDVILRLYRNQNEFVLLFVVQPSQYILWHI